MSIESITDRIIKEAEAYAEERRASAEAEKAEILEEAGRKAENILAQRERDAAKDAETLKSRRESVAALDAGQMDLAAKRELIEESFEGAIRRICEGDEEKYLGFILGQLEPFKGEGGELLLNRRDRAAYGGRLEEELHDGAVKVSEETAEIRGGFILRRGNISYNASIEKLLESIESELTAKVAGILFG